jgi:hypothetical protein
MTTTISGSSGIVFPDLTTMQTGQQAVKAWVNFNGTGTVAIRAGYNVSSITDNGVGDYTVSFTTAMADGLFGVVVASVHTVQDFRGVAGAVSTGVRIRNLNLGTLLDTDFINVAVFR